MIVIHHNKDMDGYCSGAICKKKYPEAKLIGWDYKDPLPDFEQFKDEKVILIDITFPLLKLNELSYIAQDLIVIDHHISFKKQVDELNSQEDEGSAINFTYIYEAGVAACEIGWKDLFPNEPIPLAVTLIGRYDTWRQNDGNWEGETLPFKYFMYGQCNSAETFPAWVLNNNKSGYENAVSNAVASGKAIMKYQRTMDEAATRAYSFEREAYGLRAIAINQPYFSSETVASAYNPEKHDIMIGFAFLGEKWAVSLRSVGDKADCSVIAKQRGGGGHKNAAGFEVKTFEEIWK